jgi:hypothetical protein
MKVASILAAALSLLAANEAAAGCHWTDRGLQARFILHGDEAVDAKTGLIWKRCSLGLTWDDRQGCIGEIARVGLDYALQKAKEAGSEWRVPSGPELQSIVDPACGSPVVDLNVFPDIRKDEDGEADYWTTNPVGIANLFYYFDFMSGRPDGHTRGFQLAIRLVRSGN